MTDDISLATDERTEPRLPATRKPPSEALLKFLRNVKDGVDTDPEAAAMDIVERILAADTVEAVWQNRKAIHARDITHVPLTVTGYKFNASDFESAGGAYMVVEAVRHDTGEQCIITCGAVQVMATVYQLDRLGALPASVQIVESPRPTSAGFYPLWVEPLANQDPF